MTTSMTNNSSNDSAQKFWHSNLPKITFLKQQFLDALFEIQDGSIQAVVLKIIKTDISNLTNKAKNPQAHSIKIHTSISKALLWGLLSDNSSNEISKKTKIADELLKSISPLPKTYFQDKWTILTLTESLSTHLCVGSLFRIAHIINKTFAETQKSPQINEKLLFKTTQDLLTQLNDQLVANLSFLKSYDEKSFTLDSWVEPFIQRIENFSPIKKINNVPISTDFNSKLSSLYIESSEKLIQNIFKSNFGACAINELSDVRKRFLLFTIALTFAKLQQSHKLNDSFFKPLQNHNSTFSEAQFAEKFISSLKTFNNYLLVPLPFSTQHCTELLGFLINSNNQIEFKEHPISVACTYALLDKQLIDKESITTITKNSPETILDWLFRANTPLGAHIAKLTDLFIKFDLNPKYVNENGESILYLLNKKAIDFEQKANSLTLYLSKNYSHDSVRQYFADTFRILLENDVPLSQLNLQVEQKKLIANKEMLDVFEIFEQKKLLENATPQNNHISNKKHTL